MALSIRHPITRIDPFPLPARARVSAEERKLTIMTPFSGVTREETFEFHAVPSPVSRTAGPRFFPVHPFGYRTNGRTSRWNFFVGGARRDGERERERGKKAPWKEKQDKNVVVATFPSAMLFPSASLDAPRLSLRVFAFFPRAPLECGARLRLSRMNGALPGAFLCHWVTRATPTLSSTLFTLCPFHLPTKR